MVEGTDSGPGAAENEGEKEAADALPMIQLASYALHKLFTEWECEGHKVPQLKPHTVCYLFIYLLFVDWYQSGHV